MTIEDGIGHDFIPHRIVRQSLAHRPHKHYACIDDKPYFEVPFTVVGDLATGDYAPAYPIRRMYHVALASASVGIKDNTGAPTGSAIKLNFRRINTGGTDAAILDTDDVIKINAGEYDDAATHNDTDYNIKRLYPGEFVYLRITQVGSTLPGTHLVAVLHLVPVRPYE